MSASNSRRLVIPISDELSTQLSDILSANKMKIAEVGRKLLTDYVKTEQRRLRHEELRKACIAYADVVAEVQHEWRHTEVENWPE
ncbi:MAG: hypothetical protein FJY67_08270 [Calditrichaeota bacterium]|nr:hypothetical protein [Calditrichota bacterium]